MKTIIHIVSITGGGTGKHIDELAIAFPTFRHVQMRWHEAKEALMTQYSSDNICLLHIHTIWCKDGWTFDMQLDTMNAFRAQNIPINITVHDYQWIYPRNCTPFAEEIAQHRPEQTQITRALGLMSKATNVIFPTQRVYDNYMKYLGQVHNAKVVIVPHCDIPIRYNQLCIQPIINNTVNIAFLGHCVPHKGSHVFAHLVRHLQHHFYNIQYHVFGGQHGTYLPGVRFQEYQDENLLKMLQSQNIHILCLFSMAEETYCYSLSRAINSGLPLVYIDRGAFMNRLNPSESPRFFKAPTPESVIQATAQAIQYIYKNESKKHEINDYIEIDESIIEKPAWYELNYPTSSRTLTDQKAITEP